MKMRSPRAGLTLVELVLAMAITATIALCVTGVAVALAAAQDNADESSECIQTGRSALNRIQTYVSRAKLVTAVGDGAIVFWEEDENGDGLINLSELYEVGYHAEDRTLRLHRVAFDDGMDEALLAALNHTVTLASAADCATAVDIITNDADHRDRIEAEEVDAFEVAAYPDCPRTKLVTVRLVVGEGETRAVFRSAVNLRADAVGNVASQDGVWVLLNDAAPAQ
jgi:type II secretory pathway component PulJ